MCCCCSTAQWKREVVQDHKFDFVDVKVFYDRSPIRRMTYCFVFIVVIKAILMYCADIWTAYLLITSGPLDSSKDNKIPLKVRRYLYILSIVASFLLLLWEGKKARRIIASRDIAYAYTNIAAFRFYSIRSYSHYCFFSQIGATESLTDRIAYFVYFTLKGWKRMLFADAPRQVINFVTIWTVSTTGKGNTIDWNVFTPKSQQDIKLNTTFYTTTFSFALWCITAVSTVVACFLYLPLLCNIRGNLKEYVCHKIDKRIARLLLRKTRKRILEQQRDQRRIEEEMIRAQGKDTSGKPDTIAATGRQPTLPTLDVVDDRSRPISAMVRANTASTNVYTDKRPAPGVYRRTSIESVSTTYSSVSRQPLVRQNPNDPSYSMAPPMPPIPNHHHDPYGRANNNNNNNNNYGRPQQQQPQQQPPMRTGGQGHYPHSSTGDYDDMRSDYSGRPRAAPYAAPAASTYDDARSDYGGSEYGGSQRGPPNYRPPPPHAHNQHQQHQQPSLPPIDTSRFGGPPRPPYGHSEFGGSDAGSNYGGYNNNNNGHHQQQQHPHYNQPQTPSTIQNRYNPVNYNGPTPSNDPYSMAPPRRPASPTGSVSSSVSGRYGGGRAPHYGNDNRSNYGGDSDDDGVANRYATRGGRPQRNRNQHQQPYTPTTTATANSTNRYQLPHHQHHHHGGNNF